MLRLKRLIFPVLGQPSASPEPCKGELDDPSAWDDLEALCRIGAFDDLDGPFADAVECPAQFWPGIASIGEDMPQPRAGFADRGENLRCTVAVLNIGGMNDRTEHQAQGIDHDVTLAPPAGRPLIFFPAS